MFTAAEAHVDTQNVHSLPFHHQINNIFQFSYYHLLKYTFHTMLYTTRTNKYNLIFYYIVVLSHTSSQSSRDTYYNSFLRHNSHIVSHLQFSTVFVLHPHHKRKRLSCYFYLKDNNSISNTNVESGMIPHAGKPPAPYA